MQAPPVRSVDSDGVQWRRSAAGKWRIWESAAHRHARRVRQNDKTLLRVLAAGIRLANHHGSAIPPLLQPFFAQHQGGAYGDDVAEENPNEVTVPKPQNDPNHVNDPNHPNHPNLSVVAPDPTDVPATSLATPITPQLTPRRGNDAAVASNSSQTRKGKGVGKNVGCTIYNRDRRVVQDAEGVIWMLKSNGTWKFWDGPECGPGTWRTPQDGG